MQRSRPIRTGAEYGRSSKEVETHCAIRDLLQLCGHPKLIWFHPPNGEKRSQRTGAKLMRMGVLPGVADFALTLPDGSSAYLEVKAENGVLSAAQVAFAERCMDAGVPYAIAKSMDQAKAILTEWGALRGTVRQQQKRAA